ncbi:ANL_HP_G0176900.mRNA.1.CDS.1 [Saccharomyces cerevisiae]|nr:ANL_HP_G0176900.mRNA.1.CDS.1 [Saccharomyces cerevisiae]CAI7020318.1 ANL_HP_G0176900.mRNA.1.CDS.1 [Saccharomyces cerevisiae]
MPDNLSLHLSGSSKRLNSRQLMESSNETFAPNHVDLEKEYKSSQSNITTEVYEASSFEEKVSSEKPQYSSFWKKIYYEYVVVDKSILGVSILDSFMYNQDLKPVEKERRVWSWYNYCYFWLAECFNINTWQIAATGLQLGLNWWQCWITIWIGYGFVGAFVVLASRVGSAYHLSFPISSRASFGIFFSLWPVINRVVMAIVWYSVQAYIAATPVSLMLKSIFGKDLQDKIPDHFGSPNATTYEFMCFFIFWAASLPFLLVPPHKIRHLFTVKAVLVPFASFGFLIWAIRRAHGRIALGSLTDVQPHGSAFSWAFLRSLMGCMANFSTMVINAPDFSRFSKNPNSALWSQLVCIPFLFSITCLIGILVTAAGYEIYGINYWSPLDVLEKFLQTTYNKGTRAGVFLISFVFAVAQLGTNISANSLSCGTDMSAIFPKFINIKRGSLFCAAMALCICPWNLMATSSKFTMALSAYAIFLSSIAGVVCSDYFVVRRGYIKLTHIYSHQKGSFYMYGNRFGINWRALAAYLCGVAPCLPGFIAEVGAPAIKVSDGAMKLYYLSYWVGYGLSFSSYTALCYFFPVPGFPVNNIIKDKGWFQRWANVDDFEEEWKDTIERDDLVDDNISVYEHEHEKTFI